MEERQITNPWGGRGQRREGEKTLNRTRGGCSAGVRWRHLGRKRQRSGGKACAERVSSVCRGRGRKKEKARRGGGKDGTRKRREGRRWSSWYRPAEKGVDFSTPGRRTSGVRGTCSGLDYD